jgi:hypothetical protein
MFDELIVSSSLFRMAVLRGRAWSYCAESLAELRRAHLLTYGFIKRGIGMGVLHLPADHPHRLDIQRIEESLKVIDRGVD